jgi:hypothetical protein
VTTSEQSHRTRPAMRSAPTVLWLLALGFALGILIALG